MACLFIQLRHDANRKKFGKKYSVTDLRHAYATRMLEAGMDHITLAAAMVHQSPAMIVKHYSHIAANADRIAGEVRHFSK